LNSAKERRIVCGKSRCDGEGSITTCASQPIERNASAASRVECWSTVENRVVSNITRGVRGGLGRNSSAKSPGTIVA
jgi:hypothetical protein